MELDGERASDRDRAPTNGRWPEPRAQAVSTNCRSQNPKPPAGLAGRAGEERKGADFCAVRGRAGGVGKPAGTSSRVDDDNAPANNQQRIEAQDTVI